jgi:hypothetical protein
VERRLLDTVLMIVGSEEVTRRRLFDGLVAGAIATLFMTALMLAAPALGGPALPRAFAGAVLALRERPIWLLVGALVHLGYGAMAGALFAAGARAVTIGRGVIYGLGLWGVAVAVYAPLVGLGFVASHRPGLAAMALPAHLLYGAVLGVLAPRGEIVQPLEGQLGGV